MDERQYDEYLRAMEAIDIEEYMEEEERKAEERRERLARRQEEMISVGRRRLPGYVKF